MVQCYNPAIVAVCLLFDSNIFDLCVGFSHLFCLFGTYLDSFLSQTVSNEV